jgi:hypothetical protein
LGSTAPGKIAFYYLLPNTQAVKFGHTRERNSQRRWAVLLILKEHASLWDETNKTVRCLLENFTPKNGKTHVSLFFSNLTVCCICIYRINYTNCECDSWNFLSSCLHDLRLRSFWWNIVIVDQPVKTFLNTPRSQEEQQTFLTLWFKSEKVSNLTFHDPVKTTCHVFWFGCFLLKLG